MGVTVCSFMFGVFITNCDGTQCGTFEKPVMFDNDILVICLFEAHHGAWLSEGHVSLLV